MSKLLCKNPNDEVKYMTRVQSWSSPRLLDQFQCLSTSKHINKHVHMYMYTHYTFTCTLISSLHVHPPPLPPLSLVINIIIFNIPTKGGTITRDILLKYSNPSPITAEFNTSATFEKESPPLLTHPYHSIRGSLSEQCTRRVSHQ